jgi:hypothetical protein
MPPAGLDDEDRPKQDPGNADGTRGVSIRLCCALILGRHGRDGSEREQGDPEHDPSKSESVGPPDRRPRPPDDEERSQCCTYGDEGTQGDTPRNDISRLKQDSIDQDSSKEDGKDEEGPPQYHARVPRKSLHNRPPALTRCIECRREGWSQTCASRADYAPDALPR